MLDDKNINAVCNSDCATIQGQFTTEDGKPIREMSLSLGWTESYGGLLPGGKTRKIMTSPTDGNGNYKFVFHTKDEELTHVSFSVTFTAPDDTYMLPKDYSYFQLPGANKRDTTIVGNYHLPRKGALIKLITKNPSSITGDDQLVSNVYSKYELNKSIQFVPGEPHSLYNSEATIETVANQVTFIKTSKRINGQFFNLLDSVIIPVNQVKTYEIEF